MSYPRSHGKTATKVLKTVENELCAHYTRTKNKDRAFVIPLDSLAVRMRDYRKPLEVDPCGQTQTPPTPCCQLA